MNENLGVPAMYSVKDRIITLIPAQICDGFIMLLSPTTPELRPIWMTRSGLWVEWDYWTTRVDKWVLEGDEKFTLPHNIADNDQIALVWYDGVNEAIPLHELQVKGETG